MEKQRGWSGHLSHCMYLTGISQAHACSGETPVVTLRAARTGCLIVAASEAKAKDCGC